MRVTTRLSLSNDTSGAIAHSRQPAWRSLLLLVSLAGMASANLGCSMPGDGRFGGTPGSEETESASNRSDQAQEMNGMIDITTLNLTLEAADDPKGLVKRGQDLLLDTHRLLPNNVGNGLDCTNCHVAGGTTPKAAPFVGVTGRYPKYRHRSGHEDDLPTRINGCFERSMAGVALETDSKDMKALVAYMTWLSRDVPEGKKVAGVGMPRIQAPSKPDPVRGAKLYIQQCAACHHPTGKGMYGPEDKSIFPPLWGSRSFNIGAGMARLNTAAAFVKWNMPKGQGGTLSDQDAFDVAAYFIVQERPDFARKLEDWPKGHKPTDARY
jgi:thiosulfate dehydrogenase